MINRIRPQIGRFIHEEDGPTAVEYAVMLSLIVIACIASVRALSTATRASFDSSAAAVQGAMNP